MPQLFITLYIYSVRLPAPLLYITVTPKSHDTMLTVHNQESTRWSPDPFPHKREGSGDTTNNTCRINFSQALIFATLKHHRLALIRSDIPEYSEELVNLRITRKQRSSGQLWNTRWIIVYQLFMSMHTRAHDTKIHSTRTKSSEMEEANKPPPPSISYFMQTHHFSKDTPNAPDVHWSGVILRTQ